MIADTTDVANPEDEAPADGRDIRGDKLILKWALFNLFVCMLPVS